MAILNEILNFLTESVVNMSLIWTIIVIVCALITSGIKFILKKTIKGFEAKPYEYVFAGTSTILSFLLLFGFNWVHSDYGVVAIVVMSFTHSLMSVGAYKFFCQPVRIVFNKAKALCKNVFNSIKKGKVPVKEIVDGLQELISNEKSNEVFDVVEEYRKKKAEMENKR